MPAPSQRREGQAPPLVTGDVLLVAFEPGRGRIVEHQVDVELEQVDAGPEHLRLDRVTVFRQEIQGAIELAQRKISGLRQPHPIEPALVTGELGARPGEALRRHRQQGRLVRRLQLLRCQPLSDRPADAEPGPQLRDHVDDTKIKARLDLDRPFATLLVCRDRAVGVEHPADAA
jgi:hypothetical protein